MKINLQYLDDAMQELSERKQRNELEEDRRHSEVYQKLPDYKRLEVDLAASMTDIVASLSGSTGESVEAIFERNRKIQNRMGELLKSGGFPADYLDPIYTCKKCKDKGNTGNEWCECICKLTNDFAAAALNENAPLSKSRFDNFDLGYYPEYDEKTGASPREVMKQNLDVCKLFAETFNGKGSGILMRGPTGLGKTHLSLSIANVVINKGYCVVYISVPELMRKLQDEQINKKVDTTMSLILNSDLLILDDLGAENTSDWCVATIYEIINTRQNHNLPLIINTNLTTQELRSAYYDRLSSRMMSMKTLLFIGKDNRVKLSTNFNG